ncbi:hypothetical protein FA15DRAFT_645975 [Coprinopsis marcescibilis]|uniref:RecQ-mediated genome instability protein 1 n=1 Tax=Coprinopsis marcescibilis TaxID=230819 RepID=A0A5C3KLF7_COPMA|nr:hypothetical protein FA15DRAFT_645975 [Coprinopsis marcescibilis]
MEHAVPQRLHQWIEANYPRPRIDPAWLQDCYTWLVSEGTDPDPPHYTNMIAKVEEQIHKSDLYDSTMHGTGLPVQVASPTTTTTLGGPPVLVQLVALTDVGISAFQLEQVRKAREERVEQGTVLEEGEGEGEGDVEVEGEGPMPKYPRGTLLLHLSDGVTTLKAMEYRPLPDFSLLTTPLGLKVRISVHPCPVH